MIILLLYRVPAFGVEERGRTPCLQVVSPGGDAAVYGGGGRAPVRMGVDRFLRVCVEPGRDLASETALSVVHLRKILEGLLIRRLVL